MKKDYILHIYYTENILLIVCANIMLSFEGEGNLAHDILRYL